MKRRIIHATRARRRWSAVLSRVYFADERIVIVRSGREVAAIVPHEDLELLEHPADEADIEAARHEIGAAKGQRHILWDEMKEYFEVES